MIVTDTNFHTVIEELKNHVVLACDTETTGLRPYHGDILFSIIIATPKNSFYFNYNSYPGIEPLSPSTLKELANLFQRPSLTWVFHNPKAVDLPCLEKEGIIVGGRIIDLQFLARVQNNTHLRYGLDAMAKRLKMAKLDIVAEYIKKNKLIEKKEIQGKKITLKKYNEVPFEIIAPYGEQDGRVTFDLYKKLSDKILEEDKSMPDKVPKMAQVIESETALCKVLYDMEKVGVKVDLGYCRAASTHYKKVMEEIKSSFKEQTGHTFIKSGKLFQEIFADEKDKWEYTEKGNPQFDAKALAKFSNPVAALILDYSKAKKQSEYFENFLFHADDDSVIHTDFKQAGTHTGRFSSADPNLQNLTKPDKYEESDKEEELYPVRRAFVPREGYFFAMLDYDQMEYRMMLDKARADGLIEKVLGGLDVHQATADLAGISRKQAKTVNFATLYGSGLNTLSKSLATSVDEARRVREAIFRASPEIRTFIRGVVGTAESRGFIFNWLGRRSYFQRNLAYKAPNYYIQGGCADVVKRAMVDCYKLLSKYKSRMLLTIHDELIFEIAIGEERLLHRLASIMSKIYPYRKLPLTVGIDYSFKSLADKEPFDLVNFPHGEESRDTSQGTSITTVTGADKRLGRESTAGSPTGNA